MLEGAIQTLTFTSSSLKVSGEDTTSAISAAPPSCRAGHTEKADEASQEAALALPHSTQRCGLPRSTTWPPCSYL